MRVTAMVAIALLALSTAPAAAQNAAADEAAVRDVVRRYVDAREKRDAKLLEAVLTADADQLTTSGDWRRGRENVLRGGLRSSQANPGSRHIAIEAVRFPAPDVAIADGRYEITAAAGSTARRMRTTFVMTRSGGRDWRIAAIRNMAPVAPGGSTGRVPNSAQRE